MSDLSRNDDPKFFDWMQSKGYIDQDGNVTDDTGNAYTLIGLHRWEQQATPEQLAAMDEYRTDCKSREILSQVFDDIEPPRF